MQESVCYYLTNFTCHHHCMPLVIIKANLAWIHCLFVHHRSHFHGQRQTSITNRNDEIVLKLIASKQQKTICQFRTKGQLKGFTCTDKRPRVGQFFVIEPNIFA